METDDLNSEISQKLEEYFPTQKTDLVPNQIYPTMTKEEFAARQAQADKYGGAGAGLATMGLGAARTLTFGLSDWAAQMGIDKETLNKLRETNPGMNSVGEMGALLTPFLPLGVLGKAANTGIEALSAAGSSAEKLVASGLENMAAKSVAKKIVATAAAKAAEGAVIGGGFGAGQLVSEAALGDPEAVAEHILPTLGWNILTGAGVGTLLSPLESIGDSILKKGTTAAQNLKNISEKGGLGLSDNLIDEIAKTSGKVSFENPETIKEVLKNPDASLLTKEGKNELNRQVIRDTTQLTDSFNATDSAIRDAHNMMIDELSKEADPAFRVRAQVAAQNHANALEDEVKSMISNVRRYTDRTSIDEAQEAVANYKKVAFRKDASIGDIFKAANNLRHDLGDLGFGRNVEEMTRGEANTVNKLKSTYHDVSKFMEDVDTFGPLGANQSAWNKDTNELLTAMDPFKSRFMYRVRTQSGKMQWEISSPKLFRYINNIDAARNETLDKIFSSGVKQMSSRFDQVKAMAGGPEAVASFIDYHPVLSKVDNFKQLAESLKGNLKTEQLAFKIKQLAHGFEQSGVNTTDLLAMGGLFHAFGPLGTIPYAAFKLLQHPVHIAQGLGIIQRLAGKNVGLIDSAVDGFFKAATKVGTAASAIQTPVKMGLIKSLQTEHQPGDKKTAAFNDRIDQLAKLSQNPAVAMKSVISQLGPMNNVAPEVTKQLATKTVQAAQHLLNTAPKNSDPSLFKSPWKPSDRELAAWNRRVAVIQDPSSILVDMKHGIVNREAIDTFKTVYPAQYQQVISKIIELASEEKNISWKAKKQLNLLMGGSIDRSMTPQAIAQLQQNHQTMFMADQGPFLGTPIKGSNQMFGGDKASKMTENRESAVDKLQKR